MSYADKLMQQTLSSLKDAGSKLGWDSIAANARIKQLKTKK